MEKDKLLATLRLQATKNIGAITAKKLIAATGDVRQIFKEKATILQKINGVGSNITNALLDPKTNKLATKEYHYIKENNIKCTYFLDNQYPTHLKHCIDAPILLFLDGNINLNNTNIISVVGTRKMTSYGRSFCEDLITNLAPYNPIIVSGFAYGVDICAHKTAIKNNLQTLAILAHGLDEVYPKAHKKYSCSIIKNGGFFTEFWHDEKPIRENFLKRNRIVAGISKATIIIESAKKGGSLVTADIANSYNKDVFAVPGKTTDFYSEGCNNLIKNHQAHLLTSAKDLVNILGWEKQTQAVVAKQQTLFLNLDKEEQKIYNYLKENGKQLLDVIAIECAIPIYKLSSILLQMELKGVIKPLPGKMFERR